MTARTAQLARPARSGVTLRRALRLWLATVLLLSFLVSSPGAWAQDETPTSESRTPDTELPATNSNRQADEEAQGTPTANEPAASDNAETPAATNAPEEEAGSSSSAQSSGPLSGTAPGSPAVLAQGLAFQSGGQVVWQVRGVEPTDFAGAQPEVSNAAIILQREGTSIVRNDVTAKRALLGSGEAYFKAAEDLYTTGAQGGTSTVWIFEVVEQASVAEDAFYESPVIDDYAEGTYDLQLIRYVLQPDDQVNVPPHTGTALIMATAGEVEVEDDRGPSLLGVEDNGQGQGQLMTGDGVVTNASDAPAEFVFVHFGAAVDDTSSGEPVAAPAPTEAASTNTTTPAAGTTPPAEASGDEADAATDAETPAAEAGSADGTFQTSIDITAQTDLTVTVTVDGIVAFDGPIPAGSNSGAIVGSVFEVTTSSGANTLFTNACGDQFVMGYGEGEESYTLTADANSCPP